MKHPEDSSKDRIKARRIRESQNMFSRLPSAYAASRLHGQRILRNAGGLSILEWRVLWDLYEVGPMTIRDLADIQRTDHSQLSRALPAMRKKNFVTMDRNRLDGRQIVVAIAPAGQQAYDKAAPIMKRRREALRKRFSDEDVATFCDLMDRFEDFLRQPVDTILNPDPAA